MSGQETLSIRIYPGVEAECREDVGFVGRGELITVLAFELSVWVPRLESLVKWTTTLPSSTSGGPSRVSMQSMVGWNSFSTTTDQAGL